MKNGNLSRIIEQMREIHELKRTPFAPLIREYHEAAGITRSELAEMLGRVASHCREMGEGYEAI